MKREDLKLGTLCKPLKSRTKRLWKIDSITKEAKPWSHGHDHSERVFRLYPQGFDVSDGGPGPNGKWEGGVRAIVRTEEQLINGWGVAYPGGRVEA